MARKAEELVERAMGKGNGAVYADGNDAIKLWHAQPTT